METQPPLPYPPSMPNPLSIPFPLSLCSPQAKPHHARHHRCQLQPPRSPEPRCPRFRPRQRRFSLDPPPCSASPPPHPTATPRPPLSTSRHCALAPPQPQSRCRASLTGDPPTPCSRELTATRSPLLLAAANAPHTATHRHLQLQPRFSPSATVDQPCLSPTSASIPLSLPSPSTSLEQPPAAATPPTASRPASDLALQRTLRHGYHPLSASSAAGIKALPTPSPPSAFGDCCCWVDDVVPIVIGVGVGVGGGGGCCDDCR